MSTSQRADSFELTDYLKVLRRRWLIVVIVVLLSALATVGYLYVAPKVYTASAEVAVTPTGAANTQQGSSGSRNAAPVNMDNEAQLVQSLTVANSAARILDSPLSPQALRKQVTVSVPANSQVLQISCDAATPSGAARCANAFAQAYLTNRQATATASVASQLKSLQQQIDAVTKRAAALSAKIANLPANSQERAIDQALASSDSSQLHALSNQAAALTGEGANSTGGNVIGLASRPNAPSSPRRLLILPSGLVAGILISVLLALVINRRDDRIYTVDEAERALDAPVLLSLIQRKAIPAVGLLSPRSRAGHGFIELARGVAASLGKRGHVIFVTSASANGAAALTSLNVAAALARNYGGTILVSPNLRTSLAPQMLGLNSAYGLADVLAGVTDLSEVIKRPAEIPRLQVITPGVESAADASDYEFDTINRLVSRLREEARYVVIEAAGGEDSTEAFAFAEFADAAIIVLESTRTTQADALRCARLLDQVHTVLLGSVLLSPVDPAEKWRTAPPEPVRPVAGRTRQAPAAMPTAIRRRPDPRPGPRPAQDALGGNRVPSAGNRVPSAGNRIVRDPAPTRPMPVVGPAAEEQPAKQRTAGSEGEPGAADTGTG
jgi:capsular polysaccharide biosynthesis protein/MinD-like ATPase involved in chromosome partitioning or flagellar assembly